jgi:hypothetical protein
MIASQGRAKPHAEERGEQDEVREIGRDAYLRAEPANERQLEDEDRESRGGESRGGTAPIQEIRNLMPREDSWLARN